MIAFALRHWLPLSLAALLSLAVMKAGLERSRRMQIAAEFSDYKTESWQKAQAAEAQHRATEQQWRTNQEKIANETQKDLERVRTELADARGAGNRLRIALDAARKRAAAANTSVATISEGVERPDAITVLADLLERADIRAEAVARHADELRVAGTACQRSYEALITPSP